MKINIYVATHKIVDNPLPENYHYMLVNANNKENIYSFSDNTLDNISEKNPNYCELTCGYWIWKNDKTSDVVGLAHYRRILTKNKFSSSIKSYVNQKQIEKDLKNYDFISTKLHDPLISIHDHIIRGNVRPVDLDKLEETIKDVCPDYLDTYHKVLSGRRSYLLNMLITTKEQFDAYYEWLFSILTHLETKVDMTGYNTQEQRLYGYLAERLFTVYVFKNNFKVKSYPTCIVGANKLQLIWDKILLKLRIRKRK